MEGRGTAVGLTQAARDAAFRELAKGITADTFERYEQRIEQATVALSVTLDCACVISLVSADGNRLHPIAVHHPGQEAAELIDELIERVTLEELRAARGPLVTIAQPFGASSILAVPLVGRSATLGAIVCAKGSDEALNGDDQELVCDVAGVLAMAVESELAVDGSGSSPAGDPSQRSSAGLTRREREILGHLARGYTNKEIADRLVLSVRTVEWHRARIQWKLQVSTRAELITAARALGLLEV